MLYSDNVENAINKWNTRPLEDALQKRVEELEKSIGKAVEEIAYLMPRYTVPPSNSDYPSSTFGGLSTALDILRKHGLIGGE